MPLPRRKFRELLFQILFSKEFYLDSEKQATVCLMDFLKTTRSQVKQAENEIKKLLDSKDFIDELIRKFSTEYRIERISKVELTVLRLALFELFFLPESSKKITISEAKRLCRKFGSEKSSSFVQALLNHICQEKQLEK